jgi:osomolarity two-component system, sensor histidine kinase SLN1
MTVISGGLVEISTKKDEHGRPPTRTIGDPSTGTEPTRTRSSLSASSSSPEPETPPEHPMILSEESSDVTIKPIRLELPRPRDFAIEETMAEVAASVSPLSPYITTPGSATSGGALSTSTGASSIQYESGMRVLVVDDDPLTRKLMSRMLTRLGCKVTTAENGEIALDLILNPAARPTPSSEDMGSSGLVPGEHLVPGEERYAVVFLDNQMPVMSGLEAVGQLRRRGRRDFVVGVTGMWFLLFM